jgi:hypothetical protein
MLTAIAVTAALLHQRVKRLPNLRRVLIYAGVVFAFGLALSVVWFLFRERALNGFGFAGLVFALVGFGLFVQAGRARWLNSPLPGIVLLLVGIIASVGAALASSKLSMADPMKLGIVILGVLAALAGADMWSAHLINGEDTLPPGRTPGERKLMLTLGIALLIVSIAILVYVGTSFGLLGIIEVLMFAIVLGVANDKDAEFLIVGVMMVASWAMIPSDEEVRDDPPKNSPIMLSLGDSYMSGEGANTYYEGTNAPQDDNQCRRSPQTYSMFLKGTEGFPANVVFLACSGADAVNLYKDAQYVGEPPKYPEVDGHKRGAHQLENFEWRAKGQQWNVDMVLLSIGGNDAGFGNLIKTCLAPGDCSDTQDYWFSGLNTHVAPEVRDAYAAVRKRFQEEAAVVVVPYPSPLGSVGCSWSPFLPNEHEFINRFAQRLDDVLHEAAEESGFYFAGTVETSLKDSSLQICDTLLPGGAGVNLFSARPASGGVIEVTVSPETWFHNSLHPDAQGHEAMQSAIADWRKGKDLRPPPVMPESESADDLQQRPPLERNEWLAKQLTAAGWSLIPMSIGSWFLSLVLIKGFRERRRINETVPQSIRNILKGPASR